MDGTFEMTHDNRYPRMRLLSNPLAFPLATACALALAPQARAQFLYQGWELRTEPAGQFQLSPESFIFSTNSNYGPTGTLESIQDLSGILRTEAGVAVRYGLNDRATLFGRVAWGLVAVDQTTSTYSGMGYGFTDQNVGFTVRLLGSPVARPVSPFALDLQAQIDFPLYQNTTALTSGYPYLGDGTIDVTVGPFASWNFAASGGTSWRLVAGTGYTWRSDSFSQAIPFSVALENAVADSGLTLRAAIRGQISLKSDPRGLAGETGSNVSVNGGSLTANAVNPSLVCMEGRFGYRFAPGFEAHAFAGAPAWGQDVPGGFLAGLGITTELGSSVRRDRSKPTSAEYDRSNQGFLDYSLEAKVGRVNDKLNLVKIDKGSLAGVQAGQLFDLFSVRENGSIGEAVARARVSNVQPNEAALVVIEYFREVWIDEGFIAKRVIQ